MKCDKCNKKATVHDVLIKDGKPADIHLCIDHALEAGYPLSPEAEVQALTGKAKVVAQFSASMTRREKPQKCAACGLTFAAFRKSGTLGCPACYDAFMPALGLLIERAHGGAKAHVGRRPVGSDQSEQRTALRAGLLKELQSAITAEQYERAAKIRDQLHALEVHPS